MARTITRTLDLDVALYDGIPFLVRTLEPAPTPTREDRLRTVHGNGNRTHKSRSQSRWAPGSQRWPIGSENQPITYTNMDARALFASTIGSSRLREMAEELEALATT